MHIEANRRIGDYCLIANRVAIVGRHDHDYPVVGYPTRYEPWIGSKITPRRAAENCATIEQDLRIGCKSIVSAGVTVGLDGVIAAGIVAVNSIATGSPAKLAGSCFDDSASILAFEAVIARGTFQYSARGHDSYIFEAGAATPRHHL